MFGCRRQILSAWLLAIVLSAGCIEGRRLRGWDAWPAAPACDYALNGSNGNKDQSGRFWGWESQKRASCAFKDEQQQALYPNTVIALQVFSTAPACNDAPSAFNSAPDSAGRPWGWEWGKSCAFRTAAGAPIYYEGYTGKRYITPVPALPSPSPVVKPTPTPTSSTVIPPPSPSPAAKPLPSPTPSPTVPVGPSPSPSTVIKPTTVGQPASPAMPASNPPAPAGGNSCTGAPPAVSVLLNSTAVAVAVAEALYNMISDSTNGYQGITVAEGPSSSATSSPPSAALQALLASQLLLAQAAINRSSPDDTKASSAEPVRPSDNPYVMDYLNAAASKLDNTTSTRHLLVAEEMKAQSQARHHQRKVLSEGVVMEEGAKPMLGDAEMIYSITEEQVPSPSPADIQTTPAEVQTTPAEVPATNSSTAVEQSDAKGANWETVAPCPNVPNLANSVADNIGRRWGWNKEVGLSCAFKTDSNAPIFTWETAPPCTTSAAAANSSVVLDATGNKWGWEGLLSCAHRA